jgi:hypothetical protein
LNEIRIDCSDQPLDNRRCCDRFDNTVLVRGLNSIVGADNKPVSTIRFTDVLRYLDGRWQATAAQETMVRQ